MAAFVAILTIAACAGLAHSILPQQCNANFRWDDCGRRPQPVIYYWKTGSRCEVGIWRGCLPNMNMFKDEYECVSTCIFTARAQDQHYHMLNQERDDTENLPTDDENDGDNVTTPYANVTAEPGKAETDNAEPGNTEPGSTTTGNTDPGSTTTGNTDPGSTTTDSTTTDSTTTGNNETTTTTTGNNETTTTTTGNNETTTTSSPNDS